MKLTLPLSLAASYHSNTQVARVVTENWVADNMFCPRCGHSYIRRFSNNRPVADFFCPGCGNEYELKSKSGKLGHSISDGAYDTMIQRITSNNNPDFFLLSYSKDDWKVRDFLFIPKHFFWPDMIEKRKPLSPGARRAGWTGCNILLDQIPEQGQIPIVKNSVIFEKENVLAGVRRCDSLFAVDANSRGWLFDVLLCVNHFPSDFFLLNDVYSYETQLQNKHPDNHNIRAKIRQQLQVLRDMGAIEFLGNGRYRKKSVLDICC